MNYYKRCAWLLLCFTLVLCSCSDEVKYSCDQTQDEWVKAHIDEIHSMERGDWLRTQEALSIPIYRAFTQEQKISFWECKLYEVLNLGWNEAERHHILQVLDFVKNNHDVFSSSAADEADDKLDVFTHRWSQKAQDEFGWSKGVVYSIIACGNRVLDTRGTIEPLSTTKSISLMSSTELCNCSTRSDYCRQNEKCIGEPKVWCNPKPGCGTFLMQECDGECMP